MVAPKSKVRSFTAGNFDSYLLRAEKQFSDHSEKYFPTLHMSECYIFKETKSQLTQTFVTYPPGGPMLIWPVHEEKGEIGYSN